MSDAPTTPVVPDYLKKYQTAPEGRTTEVDSMVSSSVSVPRISLKAKKFRWIEQGEEIKAEPVTNAVILGVEPAAGKMVKTFYAGPYIPGDTSPPDCTSSDGIRPDPWVSTPQNDLCATCKHNVFGSATSLKGKKSKKCRDSKRLWLVSPDDIAGTVFGMNVPVTSLQSLSEIGKTIKETGMPISAAVIEMSMFEDESYPIVIFKLAGWLGEKSAELAIARNTEKNWDGALKQLNPPVPQELLNSPSTQQAQQSPQAQPQKPQQSSGGAIEGQVMPKTSSADEVLKTWGN